MPLRDHMTPQEKPEVIRLSAGTWIGIFIALGVHAASLVSWGVTVERRLAANEASIVVMRDNETRITNVLDKLEDRVYREHTGK